MPPALVMWVHLVAAITWIGGMLFVALVLRPALRQQLPPPQAVGLLRLAEDRFRSIRWISLLILLGTGVFNLIHEGGSARLESAWGGVLMIKLLFVAVAVGLTGVNDFLPTFAASSGRSKAWLDGLILVLALFIVLIAVYLGQS